MLTRLYKLLEARSAALCGDSVKVYDAANRLVERQAERAELEVYRIASRIIMSGELSPAPVIQKFTLEYAWRKFGSATVHHCDITFDALSLEDAHTQLRRYIAGLNEAGYNRFVYEARY
jgi:hypothetical protein